MYTLADSTENNTVLRRFTTAQVYAQTSNLTAMHALFSVPAEHRPLCRFLSFYSLIVLDLLFPFSCLRTFRCDPLLPFRE